MKPIILVKDKDGKIEIAEAEIKKLISDAYDEGYRDGRQSQSWISTTPSVIWNNDPNKITLNPNTATGSDDAYKTYLNCNVALE